MTENIINDIVQWDIKSWKKAIDFWDREIDFSQVESALELGGRQGGLSLWLAKKGIHTVCSDLEDTENTARPLHEKHGVESLVSYKDIDATNIPFENHFDLICFKSIIGGIGRDNDPENQQRAFDQIYKALKPGGILLFAENLSASRFHKYLRKKFVRWGQSWRYVNLTELEEMLTKFSSIEIKTTGFLANFGQSEQQRNILAHLDSGLLNNLSPKTWKYIAYGIAVKG